MVRSLTSLFSLQRNMKFPIKHWHLRNSLMERTRWFCIAATWRNNRYKYCYLGEDFSVFLSVSSIRQVLISSSRTPKPNSYIIGT
ncbi:hypothetical protein C5167_008842 [Papaver somniferum]|uniref:Uncharacterized protein n=1 Tax=Papaver somniferum TaxID=3469 RepID=A0A4Y7JVN7_PAPSO|nr:hypothetical protein C5167_008842 [Papaver somniferum]